MTIAIDARIISTGTGRYIERLLHYLEQIDHTHAYLILVRNKDLAYYKPTNPNFTIVEADFADYSLDEQLGFASFLKKLRPDLVHFCMPQQPLLYNGKCVTTIHDLNLLRITSNDDMGKLELIIKKRIFAGLLKRVAKRSAHIITPSEFTKNDLITFARIPETKVTVTYESADKSNATPEPIPNLKDVPFIMYLGRAEPYKNNRGIILAHQKLLTRFPDLRLVIASKIDILRQADMTWVGENGYKNVDFVGFVSEEQAAWLYQNCRAYIIASFMEGFGLPGLEAMKYGAPVVSSNTTCLPEVYGEGALYFNPHSTEDMARALEEVISSEKVRHELSGRGIAQAKKYSWRRMAEQTLAVYEGVLEQK